jgi:hypothetical protein
LDPAAGVDFLDGNVVSVFELIADGGVATAERRYDADLDGLSDRVSAQSEERKRYRKAYRVHASHEILLAWRLGVLARDKSESGKKIISRKAAKTQS